MYADINSSLDAASGGNTRYLVSTDNQCTEHSSPITPQYETLAYSDQSSFGKLTVQWPHFGEALSGGANCESWSISL